MLNAAFPVHVAVLDFFSTGFTHFRDLNVKVELLASQRVVAIDNDRIAFNFLDGNHQRTTSSLGLELHARLNAFNALKRVARYFLH